METRAMTRSKTRTKTRPKSKTRMNPLRSQAEVQVLLNGKEEQ